MTLEEAKQILIPCRHSILKDPAFGDSEHDWWNEEQKEHVAYGYHGRHPSVVVKGVRFEKENALELFQLVTKKLEIGYNN